MKPVRKAVITAAGRDQRSLMMQKFIDQDGVARTALGILLRAAAGAGCEAAAIVVAPGDTPASREAAGDPGLEIQFLEQAEPRGYGDAVFQGRDFVGEEPFLHMVGDHLWVSRGDKDCARQVVDIASHHGCAVSGVQATRERELPHFGVVAGQLLVGTQGLYQIEKVAEKPTPTVAEQTLVVPGLRAGHYLCFFGLHVLTPTIFGILERELRESRPGQRISLSPSLQILAQREKHLAYEVAGQRFDLGATYGVLNTQLALALAGRDRAEVLAMLVELLALRNR